MRTLVILVLVSVLATLLAGASVASEVVDKSAYRVVLASEVEWQQLNPARGDKSPKAGTLWGDRKGTVATGFLVKFEDGFSSPPHIHNVSYRGVVISGLIHNDDPDAAYMWMPAGSFWTQPKGEVHITAARGSTNIAYIEIEKAPYLVLSFKEAFDSSERPVNVDASNVVWIDLPGVPAAPDGANVAYLWGSPQDNQLYGTLVRLPAGFSGKIHGFGSTFRAVVIQGQAQYQIHGDDEFKVLEPGSYFSSQGKSTHYLSCEKGEGCIMYVRTDGKYDVIAAQSSK